MRARRTKHPGFDGLAKLVHGARFPEDVFGTAVRGVAFEFKKLAIVLHPDRNGGIEVARLAFVRLVELKNQAEVAIEAGTYGKRVAPAPKADGPAPIAVRSSKAGYVLIGTPTKGDLCDVYRAVRSVKAGEETVAFKIARSPADADLIKAESDALLAVRPPGTDENKYAPRLIETFDVVSGGTRRRANVLSWTSPCITLERVKEVRGQIDFRDVAWMLNRVLEGLGLAHRAGYVHGAVLPPHVAINPGNHAGRLLDWCYSARIGQPLKAYPLAWKAFYPPEVFKKTPAEPSVDIYMAAGLAKWLARSDSPYPFFAFLAGCMLPSASRRPSDAWDVHEEFNELLAGLVGPRKFRHFEWSEP